MMPLDNYILYDGVMLLIKIIFSVIAVLFAKYVIPMIKTWYVRNVIVKDAVEAAEQVFKGSGKGSLKKEDVLIVVRAFLEKKGYNIDEKIINNMIESAVFAINLTKNNQKKED